MTLINLDYRIQYLGKLEFSCSAKPEGFTQATAECWFSEANRIYPPLCQIYKNLPNFFSNFDNLKIKFSFLGPKGGGALAPAPPPPPMYASVESGTIA